MVPAHPKRADPLASTPAANSEEFSPSRACRLRDVPRWDFESDVVVVGFGTAGASAAIEALAAGARTTLFEAASGPGGTSAMAGGDIYLGGGGGTPVQRANGFHDETEDFFRYMLMAGGPDADEQRTRLYADGALAHFDWLREQGVPYSDRYLPGKVMAPGTGDCLIWSGSEIAWPYNQKAKPCPRGHLPEVVGEMGGRLLAETLARRAEEAGLETHYDARALALVAGEDGRVGGAVLRIDGQVRYARAANGVILCAGGFVLNREMLQRHVPQLSRLAPDALSGGYDDGSGIRMGQSVGGAAIHMDEVFVTLPFYPPASHVKGILVNQAGLRFTNEDAYPGRVAVHCLRQAGDRIFLLVDDEIFEPPTELSRIEIAAVGQTWGEIEGELGLPPETLESTVRIHNRHASRGEDPLFHKTAEWLKPLDRPPFAALACHLGEAFYPYFTLGGLSTLPTGQVLTADRETVPGLYAAGRTCCGLPRSAEGYSSGMSLGDCTFFGRLAGRTAARTPLA
ncbi:MAG: FAD-dependent oxidoreductase [Proteobacteria bacterium]|nr:FAD-dependent oxidoreductase [Pseudomonadota bacterium]